MYTLDLRGHCSEIWNREDLKAEEKISMIALKLQSHEDVVEHAIHHLAFAEWEDQLSWIWGTYGYAFLIAGFRMNGYATGKVEGRSIHWKFVRVGSDGSWETKTGAEDIADAGGSEYALLVKAIHDELSITHRALKDKAGIPSERKDLDLSLRLLPPFHYPRFGKEVPDLLVEYIRSLPPGLRDSYQQSSFSIPSDEPDWFAPFRELKTVSGRLDF